MIDFAGNGQYSERWADRGVSIPGEVTCDLKNERASMITSKITAF